MKPEDHHCVSRGCRAIACYGFGSARKGTIRFACAAHVGLIWPQQNSGAARYGAGQEGRPATSAPQMFPAAGRSSDPAQKGLFG